ncbi:ComF family protein [Sphingomonas lacunae]|nr:ComF family protein [Sphingomonas lacunae]
MQQNHPDQNESPDESTAGTALLAPVWRGLMTAAKGVVDAVLPPRCAACRVVTGGDGGFCADCWAKLDFLVGPACSRCDVPFDIAQGEGAMCGQCIADPPPYSRVHAPLVYGEVARSIVMRLKYGRRTGFARLMARMIAGAVQRVERAGDPPLIVPVPLHRWRLWNRGFNQSAEVGRHLAHLTGWPMEVDALMRHRRTPPLRGLGRTARLRTVAGAFSARPEKRNLLAGRRVLLIDDVFTTGATAASCAKALIRAGAAAVEVAAFARVVDRDRADPDLLYGRIDTG